MKIPILGQMDQDIRELHQRINMKKKPNTVQCPHAGYCSNYGIGCDNCKWNMNLKTQDNLRFGNGRKLKML